jgi:hypothetical protein
MTTILTRVALTAALLLLLPIAGTAQRAPEPGQRVRVRLVEQPQEIEGAAHRQLLRGTLVRVTTDSLLLQLHPASAVTAIARTGIDRLDLSHGVRSRFASAVVNGASFAVVGSLERTLFSLIDRGRYGDESTLESALIGAAGGAIIGIAIGALRPQERWERLRSW